MKKDRKGARIRRQWNKRFMQNLARLKDVDEANKSIQQFISDGGSLYDARAANSVFQGKPIEVGSRMAMILQAAKLNAAIFCHDTYSALEIQGDAKKLGVDVNIIAWDPNKIDRSRGHMDRWTPQKGDTL